MKRLFTEAQLAKLREEYGQVETIDPEGSAYPKLCAFLDTLPPPLLIQVAEARVKFLSALARNRANRLEQILGRMVAEGARDVSDSEIERTLGPCVCGPALVKWAKQWREIGLLTETALEVARS